MPLYIPRPIDQSLHPLRVMEARTCGAPLISKTHSIGYGRLLCSFGLPSHSANVVVRAPYRCNVFDPHIQGDASAHRDGYPRGSPYERFAHR
jgi:hypothetical protein